MGLLAIVIWVLVIIIVIIVLRKIVSSKSDPYAAYSNKKMSFSDSMKAVGKSIGDCCRKIGA